MTDPKRPSERQLRKTVKPAVDAIRRHRLARPAPFSPGLSAGHPTAEIHSAWDLKIDTVAPCPSTDITCSIADKPDDQCSPNFKERRPCFPIQTVRVTMGPRVVLVA